MYFEREKEKEEKCYLFYMNNINDVRLYLLTCNKLILFYINYFDYIYLYFNSFSTALNRCSNI